MTKSGADYEVKLPYDDVLLPWALKHDLEVARIILAVRAKAVPANAIGLNFDDHGPERSGVSSETVTKIESSPNQQLMRKGRGRRRRYATDADRQRAYRQRKEALLPSAL